MPRTALLLQIQLLLHYSDIVTNSLTPQNKGNFSKEALTKEFNSPSFCFIWQKIEDYGKNQDAKYQQDYTGYRHHALCERISNRS